MTYSLAVMLVWKGNFYSLKSMLCCLNPDCEKPINQDTDKFCQSCGTELISLLRHRYKITKPLGQGGFGKTYLAEDTDKLKRPCVVKQLFYQGQSSNANQKIVELFMREAEQLDQLKANQQIPDLLAYFEENGFLYLVQEYIDGQDLLEELQLKGPFTEAKIEALLQDLLPVLAFIHEKGVVHRDLKPENIMRLQKDGRLMLIDFGVARQMSMSQLTVTGTKVGSPGYFSVEQFAEGKATASSDLYSIGATSFHLLTGQYPGELWTMQGYGWVNNWQEHLPHPIESKLLATINKLLQIKTEDRYQTANEVLSDLAKNPEPKPDPAKNLEQYEAELKKAVRSVYPLNDDVREGLKQLQQSLGLLDADVARIEQPILKQAEARRQEELRKQVEAQRQAEAHRQEQLKQQAEAQRQAQRPPIPTPIPQQSPSAYPFTTPNPIHPTSTQKTQGPLTRNRRQLIAVAALGALSISCLAYFLGTGDTGQSGNDPIGTEPKVESVDLSASAEDWNEKGDKKYNEGNFQEAIADYTQAIKLNPEYVSAYNNRGVTYKNLKRYDEAIADYTQAIKLNPEYANAYNNRGNTYKNLKRFDEAIADYTQAIKLNPEYADAYYNRGNIYDDLKRFDEAIADYTQAIKLNPEHADAYYNRGNIYEAIGNTFESRENFQKAASLYQQQNNPQDYQDAAGRLQKLQSP